MVKDIEVTLREISVRVLVFMAGKERVIKGLQSLMPRGGIEITPEEHAKNEVSISKLQGRRAMIDFLKKWYKENLAGVDEIEDGAALGSQIIYAMCDHLKWDAILDGLLAIACPKM